MSKCVIKGVLCGAINIEAIRWIARESDKKISAGDKARFIEVVETELSSLHEGNIARYRIRPSEYQTWQEGW